MSVKTLNNVQSLTAFPTPAGTTTYSVEPLSASVVAEKADIATEDLESFLEAENPMGCIRGVMWVMAFNAAVFLLGFMIWQSCKYL